MNVGSYSDPAFSAMVKKSRDEIKEIERRGTHKAETLEDIRDMKGKSYRTADLIKLMEKYDPEAYAEFSKYGKTKDGAYSRAGLDKLSSWLDKVRKGFKDGTVTADGFVKDAGKTSKYAGISAENEEKLSDKAKAYLAKLRDKYGDFDFFIGNSKEDFSKLAHAGSKEFSVIISADEIEKMAADEKYGEEKMKSVEKAVEMSKKIMEENGYGFGGKKGENGTINRITIEIGNDGNMKFFAELERSSEQQRERIEKAREKKAVEKKAAEKKAAEKKAVPNSVKRTVVEASSPEELIEKMKNVDWGKVADQHSGDRFNFTA